MSLSLEVLIKLFALGLGVLIFNKVVVPKIAELFVKNKYKSKNPKASLDHMIKLKINELSESGPQPNGSITNKKNTSKISSKDELVLNYFREIKDDTESEEELKQEAVWFIHLIEQLHWGESEEIKDIQIDLNKAFKSRFEITSITGVINKLIKENRIAFLKGLKSQGHL